MMSAYTELEAIKSEVARLAAPLVCRALSALSDTGAAHKLEKLNALVPCQCDHADHAPALTDCNNSGTVESRADDTMTERMNETTAATGFHARRDVIELHDQNANCT